MLEEERARKRYNKGLKAQLMPKFFRCLHKITHEESRESEVDSDG